MSEYKTIRVKPITLEYLKEYQCINCQNYHGKNHDYEHERCASCMSYVNKEVNNENRLRKTI